MGRFPFGDSVDGGDVAHRSGLGLRIYTIGPDEDVRCRPLLIGTETLNDLFLPRFLDDKDNE